MSLYLGNVLIPGVTIGDSATQENLQPELDDQDILIGEIKQVIENNQLTIKSVSEFYEQRIAELEAELIEMNESWAGDLSFTGQYANSAYFTIEGCSLVVDKQTGTAFVTVQGADSTTYENIYFNGHTLPEGVEALPMQIPAGNGGEKLRYHTQVLTGIKSKINVLGTMEATDGTDDYVQVSLTVTYA